MNLVNFSHPLTPEQLEQVVALVKQPVTSIQNVTIQFEVEQPFVPQVILILDELNVASERWQSEAWLIVLPSLNYIAAILLAELHARMGHFPAIIRLKPEQRDFVTVYSVTEIINLEQVRQEGRKRR